MLAVCALGQGFPPTHAHQIGFGFVFLSLGSTEAHYVYQPGFRLTAIFLSARVTGVSRHAQLPSLWNSPRPHTCHQYAVPSACALSLHSVHLYTIFLRLVGRAANSPSFLLLSQDQLSSRHRPWAVEVKILALLLKTTV